MKLIDKETIDKFNKYSKSNNICNNCGNVKMILFNRSFLVPTFRDEFIELLIIICSECGHVEFFSKNVIDKK